MSEPLTRLEPLDAIAAAFSQHLTAEQCRAGIDRLAAKDACDLLVAYGYRLTAFMDDDEWRKQIIA